MLAQGRPYRARYATSVAVVISIEHEERRLAGAEIPEDDVDGLVHAVAHLDRVTLLVGGTVPPVPVTSTATDGRVTWMQTNGSSQTVPPGTTLISRMKHSWPWGSVTVPGKQSPVVSPASSEGDDDELMAEALLARRGRHERIKADRLCIVRFDLRDQRRWDGLDSTQFRIWP
jgi:hypothetical protein